MGDIMAPAGNGSDHARRLPRGGPCTWLGQPAVTDAEVPYVVELALAAETKMLGRSELDLRASFGGVCGQLLESSAGSSFSPASSFMAIPTSGPLHKH
jgi:hypothetical protein